MATMRAIQAIKLGKAKDVFEFVDNYPKPAIEPGKGQVLVKVLTCSLSPGDFRRLNGEVNAVMKPPSMPFIPIGDICGVVEQVDEGSKFTVGQTIVATWDGWGNGGLGEYAVVEEKRSVVKPDDMTAVEGAALANSAAFAVTMVRQGAIKQGDRVLVLGGAGGLGSCVIQLAKAQGAGFVAATSTQVEVLESLGADRAIDYTKENWWEIEDFRKNPFDVVFDCAEGVKAWHKAKKHHVIKGGNHGGRWVAGVLTDWFIDIRSKLGIVSFFGPVLGRKIGSALNPWSPKYSFLLDSQDAKSIAEVFDLVNEKKLRVLVDPRSPFPFTLEGAIEAFNVLEQRKGHGKLVIEVAKEVREEKNSS